MTGFMITGKWKQEEKGMQHPQKLVPSQRDPKREMKFLSLIALTFHMQVKIFHSKLSLIAMFRKINLYIILNYAVVHMLLI